MSMINDLREVIITKEELEAKCKELAAIVQKDVEQLNEVPIFLGLLKGCLPFMSDLTKEIDAKIEVDYMSVSSFFGQTKASGEVNIVKDMSVSVKDRHVYIVEDIIDSGRTLKKVKELLLFRGAKSVKVITMTDKPSGRTVEFVPDYYGFIVPDAFLIGYGLDFKEQYRNLVAIGIPKDEIIKGEE
ncbi:MAG: hypoxanthine phosphoribosyltransferase [Mycoplasmatales bacterium]